MPTIELTVEQAELLAELVHDSAKEIGRHCGGTPPLRPDDKRRQRAVLLEILEVLEDA